MRGAPGQARAPEGWERGAPPEGADNLTFVRRVGPGYLLLAALVVAYAARQCAREPWMGDFWEHAAVVRALAVDPWSPGHPELAIDAPHAFISPYSLLVTGIARVAGVDAVRALGIAGILNAILLLAGLRAFVGVVSGTRAPRAAFYALLFVLLLWGRHPWVYSGCFHLLSLGYVLPYPSTFSAGLALVACAAWARSLGAPRVLPGLLAAAVAGLLFVTHPPTWSFLMAGMAAFAVAARAGAGGWAGIALAAGTSIAAALVWPYYPAFRLMFSEQAAFHASNKFMYERVLSRASPALLAIPLAAWDLRRGWRNPLVLTAAILFVFYAYGRLSCEWNYGRSLPFLILLAHVQIACSAAAAEERWIVRPATQRLTPWLVAAACAAFAFSWQIMPVVEVTRTDKNVRAEYGFLAGVVGPRDVVLTDLDGGWYVPAFAGRIVASRHPVAFVADHEDRVRDVRRFFGATAGRAEREGILTRREVKFILLDRRRPETARLEAEVASFGSKVSDDGRFLLVRVGA